MSLSAEKFQAGDVGEHFAERERPSPFPYSSPRAPLDPPPPPHPDEQDPPADSGEGPALARARSRARSVSPWLFVMATALNTMVASILAVIITLGVVRQERSNIDPREAMPASAYGQPAARIQSEAAPAKVALQEISLQPIGSPDQPLLLEPRKPALLALQISPKEAANEPFILTLSGAPAGTILSGAIQMSSDTWFLSPGSANLLEIALPEWSTSVFEITLALRRTNGLMAAQTKAWLAAPPPANRLPASPTIYQRAAELGSAAAALALGATYDPNRLWSLGAVGLMGNKERARQWYMRASELGHPEARARLAALGF